MKCCDRYTLENAVRKASKKQQNLIRLFLAMTARHRNSPNAVAACPDGKL
jgi:hypothetical protein